MGNDFYEAGENYIHPLAGLVKCMDCGSTMSKTANGRKGVKQVSYLRCKLYADSGEQKLCTRSSICLDRLIELVLERLRYYVQTGCTPEKLELPTTENTRREALAQENKVFDRTAGKVRDISRGGKKIGHRDGSGRSGQAVFS